MAAMTSAVRVRCECGTSYDLKDEFAGRLSPRLGAVPRGDSAATLRT